VKRSKIRNTTVRSKEFDCRGAINLSDTERSKLHASCLFCASLRFNSKIKLSLMEDHICPRLLCNSMIFMNWSGR